MPLNVMDIYFKKYFPVKLENDLSPIHRLYFTEILQTQTVWTHYRKRTHYSKEAHKMT